MSDDDAKDTQVLPKEEAGFLDMEGTEEMDRAALLARLQADAVSRTKEPAPIRESSEIVSPGHRDTTQQPAITDKTIATDAHPKATPDPTQHYVVPDSLLKQSRDTQAETVEVPIMRGDEEPDDDLPTTTFSMDSFFEFEGIVDDHGRIALPESAVRGKVRRGSRLKVVVYVLED